MRILKKMSRYLIIFLIVIILLELFNVLTCMIPKECISSNVKKSAIQLERLGEKNKVNITGKTLVNFYFTDILMINVSYSIDNNKPFESSIISRKNYNSSTTKNIQQMGKDVMADSKYMNIENGTAIELNDFVNKGVDEAFEYSRYWNGYTSFLRPLLCFLDYKRIVYLFFLVTLILSLVLSVELYKKSGLLSVCAFIVSIALTDIWASALTINTNICFMIGLIGSIIILKRKSYSTSFYNSYFLVLGILTNFYDLLTMPLISLGYPLICLIIKKRSEKSEDIITKEIIKYCIFYGIGYAMCWITKWGITDLIYNKSIINNALNQIIYRTYGDKLSIMRLISNIVYYFDNINLIIVVGIFIIYYLTHKRKTYYSIIIYLPFIWYFILKNHSAIHAFFTYKNISITIFAILIAIFDTNTKKTANTNIIVKEPKK